MSTKYFLEYKNKIFRNIGRDDSDTENKVIDSFNEAMDIIATNNEMDSLKNTETITIDEGVYIYSLDSIDLSDLQHLYSIKIYDETRYWPPLDYVIPTVWDAEVAPFIHTLSGRPYMFTFFDDTIYLASVPDVATYTAELRFTFWPARVYDDFSLVDLTEFDTALISLATGIFWLKIEEVELYDTWTKKAAQEFVAYSRNSKVVVDFKSKSATRRNSTFVKSNYWADPFQRKNI